MLEPSRPIDLIGAHARMQRVKALIDRVGPTDATVLILGESGTGKEVVARSIHAASTRADKPFVAVNCGAIPAELLESEMFGHERGSFTGAVESREGLFQIASTGSIFLDEVAEMSPALQVKLLRVLQDREIRPVGSRRTIHVDVRVTAATNKDLGALVARGQFREDLYYRLEVIPIDLPPLRERTSDIPLLIAHFLGRQNAKRPGQEVTISEDAMVEMCERDWPGNVRELENTIERLVILCENRVVRAPDVKSGGRAQTRAQALPALTDEGFDLAQAVEEFEGRLIEEALRRTRGNKQAAARMLGVKRTTLNSKLRRRGDVDPDVEESDEDDGESNSGAVGGRGPGRPTLQ